MSMDKRGDIHPETPREKGAGSKSASDRTGKDDQEDSVSRRLSDRVEARMKPGEQSSQAR